MARLAKRELVMRVSDRDSMEKQVGWHSKTWDRKLAVRRSRIDGLGLFAKTNLPARRKIGVVSGRLVPLPQSRQNVERDARIFLVELSRRIALDCSQGNRFRHLNHSCAPNCYLRVFNRTVEVYTLKRITVGEELTLDYGVTPHKGGMACHCLRPGCRRRL